MVCYISLKPKPLCWQLNTWDSPTTSQNWRSLFQDHENKCRCPDWPELNEWHPTQTDPKEQDQIAEELMDNQPLDTVAVSQDPTSFDIEDFWGMMSSKKNKVRNILQTTQHFCLKRKHLSNKGPWFPFLKVTGLNQFESLLKTAFLILVLPHSNATPRGYFQWLVLIKINPE